MASASSSFDFLTQFDGRSFESIVDNDVMDLQKKDEHKSDRGSASRLRGNDGRKEPRPKKEKRRRGKKMEEAGDADEEAADDQECERLPQTLVDDGYGVFTENDDEEDVACEEPGNVVDIQEEPGQVLSKRQMHRAMFGFNRRSGGKKHRSKKSQTKRKPQKIVLPP